MKRSEKLCPECNNKNPIRCFKCKNCEYFYPQKIKPEKTQKEKEKTMQSENKKMEEFFMNFTQKKKENENDKIIIEKDKIQDKIDENEIKNNWDVFINNLKNRSNNSNAYSPNFEENDTKVEIIDENINEPNNKKYSIIFPNFDLSKAYSFDCLKLRNENLFCVISYYNNWINKIVICCFEILFSSIQQNKNNNIENNFLDFENFEIKSQKSIAVNYSYEEIIRFSNKILKDSPLFIFSVNNRIILFLFDENKEIIKIDEIQLNEHINKFDAIISGKENFILKVIMSDYENRIYLYNLNNNKIKDGFKLISIYERHFNYKITDLQFLPFDEELKLKNNSIKLKNYFCASSRDGTIKIFDDLDPFKIVFFHRSTELWITKFYYDKRNDILFYSVNSNLTERLVSIKFFNNKEYCVKRIPETEFSIFCLVDEIFDRLYILKGDGKINYVDLSAMIEMYNYSRSKNKYQIILKKFFKSEFVEEKQKNLVVSPEVNNNENSYIINYSNHFDYFSKFFLFNFIHKESSTFNQILILPLLDKININILSKKFSN